MHTIHHINGFVKFVHHKIAGQDDGHPAALAKPREITLSPFLLSSSGHTIQDATEDGESLLSLACSAGYFELAEVLLRMRASVEDRGVKG